MDRDHLVSAHSPTGAPAASSRVALVVDREPLVRGLLRAVLLRQGWEVIEAATATESAASLDGHRPGLLVIDPTPSARIDDALVAEVRTRNPGAWIVVISDHPHAEVMARAIGARFMPKPFEVRDLIKFVASTAGAQVPLAPAVDRHGATLTPTTDIRATADALDAWRAAERRFDATPPGSPERSQAEFELDRRRLAYRHLVERQAQVNEPGRPASGSPTQRPRN